MKHGGILNGRLGNPPAELMQPHAPINSTVNADASLQEKWLNLAILLSAFFLVPLPVPQLFREMRACVNSADVRFPRLSISFGHVLLSRATDRANRVIPCKDVWLGQWGGLLIRRSSVTALRYAPLCWMLLKGSWDLVTGVIIRVTMLIITYNPNYGTSNLTY